jgi:beta-glucosidase
MSSVDATDRPSSVASLVFPPSFVWGAATAAYQIEGAAAEDGRTPSMWDVFSHTLGKVANGDTGDVAADHYHRYRDDVALMADLGIAAYRFSVSWPRVIPGGVGAINPKGIDFYSRLVDELLNAGIAPTLTLYHWDLPAELEEAGGWTNRDTAYRFADYAAAVAGQLGDRVPTWTTLNEPWCSAFLGYGAGEHAPGHTDSAEALTAAHHLLLAHGLAVPLLRSTLPAGATVCITLNPGMPRPVADTPEDRAAADKVYGLQTRMWTDALFRGAYPADVQAFTSGVSDWSFVQDGDLDIISAPIDILGVNFYNPGLVGRKDDAAIAEAAARGEGDPPLWPGCSDVKFLPIPGEQTAMGWPVDETGLTELLLRLHRDYGVPLVITENGAAYDDVVSADGQIHDAGRVSYIRRHLEAAHRAITDGVDLRGYYVWSLMDNFEWAWGYDKRFGVVRVDFDTQQRTIKDSGRFYKRIVEENALPSHP